MSNEVEVMNNLPAVIRRELVISPVMDLDVARSRMEQFQQFVAHYLEESKDGGQDGGDYGPIPGAGKKKVLLKSGADKLCELYGLYDEYEIEAQEDFGTKLFYYKIKCILKSRRDDSTVGTGVGSCSTYESKYRWRQQDRTCPKCGNTTIIKGQEQYGGGWICWAKKGGCGAKYNDLAKQIIEQTVGRVENPDIMDTVNTVLKMAKKRAKIDAVIGVTRSSGIFTQDMEDVPMPQAKPPVERTTEEIPIEKPRSAASNGGQGGGAPVAPAAGKPPKAAEREPGRPVKASSATDAAHALSGSVSDTPAPGRTPPLPPVDDLAEQARQNMTATPASLPADAIETGQAINFAKTFKDALKPALRKREEEIRHAWLKKQGIVDGDGQPTAKAILKQNFYEVREQAVEYAASLESWQ